MRVNLYFSKEIILKIAPLRCNRVLSHCDTAESTKGDGFNLDILM